MANFNIQLNKNSEICSNLNSKDLQWCLLTKQFSGFWLHNPRMKLLHNFSCFPPSSNAFLIVSKSFEASNIGFPKAFMCAWHRARCFEHNFASLRLRTLQIRPTCFSVVSHVHAHARINLLAHCSLMLTQCALTQLDRHSSKNFAGSTIF